MDGRFCAIQDTGPFGQATPRSHCCTGESPQHSKPPEAPTFAELVYPGTTGRGFNALYAPPGTSKEVVLTWSQALVKAVSAPDLHKQLLNMGVLPMGKGPEELDVRGAEATARWEPVIKASGFVAD